MSYNIDTSIHSGSYHVGTGCSAFTESMQFKYASDFRESLKSREPLSSVLLLSIENVSPSRNSVLLACDNVSTEKSAKLSK